MFDKHNRKKKRFFQKFGQNDRRFRYHVFKGKITDENWSQYNVNITQYSSRKITI